MDINCDALFPEKSQFIAIPIFFLRRKELVNFHQSFTKNDIYFRIIYLVLRISSFYN